MKKYLHGGWNVIKNYLFGMLFFYIFYIGFYGKAALFSIGIFVIMALLIYHEMAHYVGKDKRLYGNNTPYDGAIYGLIGIAPFILIQIIIYLLNFEFTWIRFDIFKMTMIKGFMAPMLFIVKGLGYSIWSFIIGWASLVLFAFLGYFAGVKGFDLSMHVRKLVGLSPRKTQPKRGNRR